MTPKEFNGNGNGNGHGKLPHAMPKKSRLGLKLAALFAMTLMVVVGGGFFYDIFGSIVERSLSDAAADQPASVVIDPKLKTELNKVLSFETASDNVAISDPFVDRAGLSAALNKTGATQASASNATPGSTAAVTASKGGSTQTITMVKAQPPDPKQLFQGWVEKQSSGNQGPVSEALMVNDLVPIGFSSGGAGQDEVVLYSLSLCRSFSFPLGAHFYDGFLRAFNRQEVLFMTGGGASVVKSVQIPQECNGTTASLEDSADLQQKGAAH